MRAAVYVCLGIVLAIAAGNWNLQSDDEPATDVTAGSVGVIDASRYDSLQAAIDALPATGGVIEIPPGTYEISEPIVITGENVLIRGSGPATNIINTNTEGAAAIRLIPANIEQLPAGQRPPQRWRIQLADFMLTGSPESGHGIEAVEVNEIFIHGVTVTNHGGDGIRLDHCYEDPRICDCLITYNDAAGVRLLGCHDIVVSATHFEENQDALVCSDGFNLCMNGNNLDDHLRHGVVIENTYGSVVSGNMIEECAASAIILDRDCYGTTLSANVIAHNGQGIDLIDAHGCCVSANTFTIMQERALRIGPGSGRITVTGNNFSDSYLGDGLLKRAPEDQSSGGLVLEGTSDVAISGNVFSGLTEPAITLTGKPSVRVLFADNVLTNVESEHAALSGGISADNLEP